MFKGRLTAYKAYEKSSLFFNRHEINLQREPRLSCRAGTLTIGDKQIIGGKMIDRENSMHSKRNLLNCQLFITNSR
jgi:hypothetical protein